MRFYGPLLLAASASVLFVAGAASAAPHNMSDVTYIAVAQCAGMAEGVGADATPFNAALDTNVGGRTGDILDRADQARADSKLSSSHEGPDGKAALTRKLDTACKSYISAG